MALVIDTCGGEGYVAVFPVDAPTPDPLSERHLGVRATQEELLPAIAAVLGEAGTTLQGLIAVAVVSGPGSFTGVRIGLATAKGLCEAAGLPLVAMSRLRVLAGAVSDSPVWAWLQAGRGDVYATRSGRGDAASDLDGETVDGEAFSAQVVPVERAADVVGADAVAVCEEGLRTAAAGVVFVEQGEMEASLRGMAAAAIREGRWSDVALTDALYLRVPDAELALRARQGFTQGLQQG